MPRMAFLEVTITEMNRKLLILALLSGAGVLLYPLLNDTDKATQDAATLPNTQPQAGAQLQQEPDKDVLAIEQARRASMRTEYEKLEQARNDVRKQLGRLKAGIWKLRVPPEQARAIEKRMYQGHILLKNPPLLGAFSSVDDIGRELEKVNTVYADLVNLEGEIVLYK